MKNMIKIYITLLLFLFSTNVFAQVHKPIDTADYLKRKDFLKKFSTSNELLIKDLKAKYSGKTEKELSKIYKEFGEDFEKQVANKDFIFTSIFDEKAKNLIDNLRKNNPKIPKDLKILIAKDNTPNAFCLADGTFVINMGLFNWLDNDDQIAAIISHELGHNIERHSLKIFLDIIEQDQLDKITVQNIKSSTENKNKKAFDILKNRVYKKGAERRNNEMQADSLGYTIFKNSDFTKTEYVNALQKLKDFDTISPRKLKMETYKKYFNLPKQAFQEKWMKKEDFSLYNYNHYKEKLNKDSLSSHPEMTLRIQKLKQTFPELKADLQSQKPTEDFLLTEKAARMEILPNFYHSEDYGLGIYASLQFLQDNEEEQHYRKWLGKCFAKIYEARKSYNLNRYLDRVEPKDQSESYRQFLSFMWNLSLEEIKNIAEYYNTKES